MPYRKKDDSENKWKTQKSKYVGKGNPKWRGGLSNFKCANCKKNIKRRKSETKRSKNFFCSTRCHDIFRTKPLKRIMIGEMKQSNHPRWIGDKKCQSCRKLLLTREERQRKYCSTKCLKSSYRKNVSGNKSYYWKNIPSHPCPYCGKPAGGSGSDNVRAKFCSRVCFGLYRTKYWSRENNPLWKGGNPYPKEWNDTLKYRIRKRDNFTCQICSLYQKGYFENSPSLDVHHIDWNKQNCKKQNLVALCRGCHRKVHAKKDKKKMIKYLSDLVGEKYKNI